MTDATTKPDREEREAIQRVQSAEMALKRAQTRFDSAGTAFARSRKAVTWNGDTLEPEEFNARRLAHETALKALVEAAVMRGEARDEHDSAVAALPSRRAKNGA